MQLACLHLEELTTLLAAATLSQIAWLTIAWITLSPGVRRSGPTVSTVWTEHFLTIYAWRYTEFGPLKA
jgi:hypothetical protein